MAEHGAADELSPEELLEQIKQLRVTDMVISSMSTIAQLGYAKLDASTRDLEQARIAIEALKALIPVVEDSADEAVVRDFKHVLANLQLAYADAASGRPPDGDG